MIERPGSVCRPLSAEMRQAIQDYGQAIRLNPRNVHVYEYRGNAYLDNGDYDRAIKDFDQAIALNPKNVRAYENRGVAHFYQGDFKAAAASLLAANELELDAYTSIWRYLARERLGEDGMAELEASAARLQTSNWPHPVIELYLGRRSPAEVLSVGSKASERCEAQLYSGEWYLLRGDRATAINTFQAAADSCPSGSKRVGAVAELKRLSSDNGPSK